MSAAAQAPVRAGGTRRRVPRVPLAVPVDLTVLRSGSPLRIPGRSLNIGELGMAAALSGELPASDPVGVEFRLPGLGIPLQTRAMVRHQARLCCGIEFLGLSPEQQAIVRYWMQHTASTPPESPSSGRSSEIPGAESSHADGSSSQPPRDHRLRRPLWMALLVLTLVGGLSWWRWYRAWEDLESRIPTKGAAARQPQTRVPPEVMARRVIHRVEPLHPVDAASHAKVHGIVVLRVVIGRDGTVLNLRPLSGPDALAPTAMDAVKWWRYFPYVVEGRAVEVETTVAVEFPSE